MNINEPEYDLPSAIERINVLNDALRPLVAMWKRHERIVMSGRGGGQEEAYYCFYSGHHQHWEKAVKVLEDEGKP